MNYYLKRIGQAVFTVWAVMSIAFLLTRWMPGGPLDYIRAQFIAGSIGPSGGGSVTASPERIRQFNEMAELYVNLNPSDPLYVQYIDYMTSLLTGDLGHSIMLSEPVIAIVGPAIPWTVFIGSIGVLISFVSRVLVGATLAYYEGTRLDFTATTALIWIHALPFYIAAILMIYILGYQHSLFPIGGQVASGTVPGLNWPFISGIIEHAALPVIALSWASFGAGAVAMRANAIQILGKDYMRVARLRGIRMKRLTTRYVARNSILPMYTELLISVGFMFGGSVLLETIFQYEGIGYWMFRAIQSRDYPLMMGCFLVITVAVAVALVIADLTYGLVDPRIKRGDESESF